MVPHPFETRLCEHHITGGGSSARKRDQRGHRSGKPQAHHSFYKYIMFALTFSVRLQNLYTYAQTSARKYQKLDFGTFPDSVNIICNKARTECKFPE
jgi:hypothetical protein